ncbi:MAG: LytTR family DNA-binding domain-containing protein [Lentimicrobiaceae bacterium]|nr:LytTR family DNA-binding domain-containing protein [Lentimicrobiaceae bacterium]
MIKTIIIEDEIPAQEILRNYLEEYCPDVEIVNIAGSVKKALVAISIHQPQLLFLDIELPDGTGFDVLRQINHFNYKVIFMTAFQQYAVEAFHFYAVHYLMKPLSVQELIEAMNRVRKEFANSILQTNIHELLKHQENQLNNFNKLMISTGSEYKVIDFQNIVYCKAEEYCTLFIFIEGKSITSSKHLKYYEKILMKNCFLRVHHSFLVNLKFVTGLSKDGNIHLNDKNTIPLGDTYRKSFMEAFGRCRK